MKRGTLLSQPEKKDILPTPKSQSDGMTVNRLVQDINAVLPLDIRRDWMPDLRATRPRTKKKPLG
ncbi:MAG: hypothetical protein GKR83_12705 [Synechococcus sp. s2_metabat2_7]|jgi:hypothetical protein|nr:hypothetical protein [Synechococcus sp. s2_metabat2_7]